jgi:hypothetical protein
MNSPYFASRNHASRAGFGEPRRQASALRRSRAAGCGVWAITVAGEQGRRGREQAHAKRMSTPKSGMSGVSIPAQSRMRVARKS